jgi:hypothetical protein
VKPTDRPISDRPTAKTDQRTGASGLPAYLIGIAGLIIVVAIALRVLIPSAMDPTVFVAFGDQSPIQTPYGERLLGSVATRHGGGHDGQSFFIQANDPWYLHPEEHAALLDRPVYRAQRMLFPMIAGGFGFFPPDAIVWAMLLTNLLALAIGAFLAAKLAVAWGGPAWLGLWVPLNVGLLFELDIGGSGILAYVCCLGALYALTRERLWPAAGLFAAAALSRETMVAFAAGVFLLWWFDRRRALWPIVLTPLVAMVVWNAYLWFRLQGVPGVGGGTGNFGLPFLGIAQAAGSWVDDPVDLLFSLVFLAVIVAFVPLALRGRLPIAWGALPFAALAIILSVNVWREPFNSARAIAPIFTALPFAILIPRGSPSPSLTFDRERATA